MSKEILNQEAIPNTERSRDLLPIWIKIFVWFFIVFGFFAPICLLLGILGFDVSLALYGLEATNALTVNGLIIILLFSLKGIVSFGLWTEKKWAVGLAIVDAILGIISCAFIMIILPFLSESGDVILNLRLEFIVLIPYLLKMNKIKFDWENRP